MRSRGPVGPAGRTTEVDDTSRIVEQPSLWLDHSLAIAIRRQQSGSDSPVPTRGPKAAANPEWLAAPYRMPAAPSADGDLDGWHEVDDWLVAGHAAAQAVDAADWLVVRE